VTQHLSPDDAAYLIRPVDLVGMPLGPGQPPALLEALGRRNDWEDLRIVGALLTVFTDLFTHPNVHYLSGFYGPLERILRDAGANVGFAPADFRRFEPLLDELSPRVMTTAAAPPDADGNVSLSLHAGATVRHMRAAAADPERLLIVEVSDAFPRTYGFGDVVHAIPLADIDVVIESDKAPVESEDAPPTDVDRAIAQHVRAFVPEGATLQTGIGAVPSLVAALLAEGDGGGYGIHSEMFTNGLMTLCQSGKVTNLNKGTYDGVSVTTFAAGNRALYDWLHENRDVAFLPVEYVNSPEAIARNRSVVTINAAMSIDIQGQVIADTIGAAQYSGIGGHEDFVAGPAIDLEDRSLLCLPSTVTIGDEMRSRIVPWFEAGAVITTPRHQVDVIVTEYGAAELAGKTVHQRGEALAAIAHPAFREGLREAAERASHGRAPF